MLHGKLITLRPMERDDIPRLWEFCQDLTVGLLTGFSGRPTPLAAVERIFEERYANAGDRAVIFGIEAHDLLIGGIEIREIDWQNRSAELILYIGDQTYRARGCGTDALLVALNYAFKVLGIHRLSYRVPEDNEAARRCYISAGFQEEGRLREAYFKDGAYHDLIMLGIVRDDWKDTAPIEELTRIPSVDG